MFAFLRKRSEVLIMQTWALMMVQMIEVFNHHLPAPSFKAGLKKKENKNLNLVQSIILLYKIK